MDLHHRRVPNSTTSEQKKRNQRKQKDGNSLKVVYISTPMKVRTSTARFRTLVQQLTGKNSDIAEYMDTRGGSASEFHDDYEFLLANEASGRRVTHDINVSTTTTTTTTPTTSDSFAGPTDNMYTFQMEEQLARVFSSEYYCCDPSQLDALASYEDLII